MSFLSVLTFLYNNFTNNKTKEDYDKMLVATVERLKFSPIHVVDFLYLTHSKEDIALVRKISHFEFEEDEKNGYLFSNGEEMLLNIGFDFKIKGVMIHEATEQMYYDISEQVMRFFQSEGYYLEKKDIQNEESMTFSGYKVLFHNLRNPQHTILVFFKKHHFQNMMTVGIQYS
jgi:hypothetical protein